MSRKNWLLAIVIAVAAAGISIFNYDSVAASTFSNAFFPAFVISWALYAAEIRLGIQPTSHQPSSPLIFCGLAFWYFAIVAVALLVFGRLRKTDVT